MCPKSRAIHRDRQQRLGLAHRLPLGRTPAVDADYGVRRLEAAAASTFPRRAEVLAADTPDSRCTILMHSENERSEGVSALQNAAQ